VIPSQRKFWEVYCSHNLCLFQAISLERDKYELNVTAMDDGSCCADGENTIHTSTAVVVVFITDVNDNKPVFKDCNSYTPRVEEGAPNGSPVIKVN